MKIVLPVAIAATVQAVSCSTSNGSTINDFTVNGSTVNGSAVNGSTINGTQVGDTKHSSTCQDLMVGTHVTQTTVEKFSSEEYSVRILYALAEKQILVSGSYNLSARYCPPGEESGNKEKDALQLLVHGATFSKIMWDFPYQRERYSWVKRMSEEGYPTLALDLIGCGNSTHPDGLLEAQTQTYVETIHQLIQKLRSGEVDGKKWTKIIFVGFSIGSIIANSLADQYPDDIDAMILHGVSWDTSWIYPAFLSGLQAPAQQIDPNRWGHVPATYQTQSTRDGRKAACFAGSYDPDILKYDWLYRDLDSSGAAITFTYHLVAAPKYKGPVFLGIGSHDSTFCGGVVCKGQPYEVYDKFAGASAYEVRVYAKTGHVILFHDSGLRLMEDTLAFLKRVNF